MAAKEGMGEVRVGLRGEGEAKRPLLQLTLRRGRCASNLAPACDG